MLGICATLRQRCWRGGAAFAHIHQTMRRLVLPLTTLALLTLVLLDRVGDLAQRMNEAAPAVQGASAPMRRASALRRRKAAPSSSSEKMGMRGIVPR